MRSFRREDPFEYERGSGWRARDGRCHTHTVARYYPGALLGLFHFISSAKAPLGGFVRLRRGPVRFLPYGCSPAATPRTETVVAGRSFPSIRRVWLLAQWPRMYVVHPHTGVEFKCSAAVVAVLPIPDFAGAPVVEPSTLAGTTKGTAPRNPPDSDTCPPPLSHVLNCSPLLPTSKMSFRALARGLLRRSRVCDGALAREPIGRMHANWIDSVRDAPFCPNFAAVL